MTPLLPFWILVFLSPELLNQKQLYAPVASRPPQMTIGHPWNDTMKDRD